MHDYTLRSYINRWVGMPGVSNWLILHIQYTIERIKYWVHRTEIGHCSYVQRQKWIENREERFCK